MRWKASYGRAADRFGIAMVAFLFASFVGLGQAGAQGARVERFFDDWNVLCVEDAEGATKCNLRQFHITSEPRREVFRWVIGRAEAGEFAGQLVSVLQAPLGVSLDEGVTLTMEGAEPVVVDFDVCGSSWCLARIPLADEMAEHMSDGKSIEITYRDSQGRTIRSESTTRGFREALQYMLAQQG